jgi:hypothetical protein
VRKKPVVVLAILLPGIARRGTAGDDGGDRRGASVITRTVEPRKVYDEVDWGLLVAVGSAWLWISL